MFSNFVRDKLPAEFSVTILFDAVMGAVVFEGIQPNGLLARFEDSAEKRRHSQSIHEGRLERSEMGSLR